MWSIWSWKGNKFLNFSLSDENILQTTVGRIMCEDSKYSDVFFVVFNKFSNKSKLQDEFRKHFRNKSTNLHTFTREECLQHFKVDDDEDDVLVMNAMIKKLPSKSALFLDETSLARPNNSFDWSSLENPDHDKLLLVSFQPVLDTTKKSNRPVKLKFPTKSDNIELTRSYRFTSSVFESLEDILYLSNIRTINSKSKPIDLIQSIHQLLKN